MRKRKLIYIFFALWFLGLIGFASISDIWGRSPIIACTQSGFASRKQSINYYTHPQKLVIQPWRGQHHVYGLFVIPGGYLNDKLFTVTIPGSETYCGVLEYVGIKPAYGIDPQRGNYLMKGYLNTRAAMFLILQGKAEQLKQPTNWKVGYVDESRGRNITPTFQQYKR